MLGGAAAHLMPVGRDRAQQRHPDRGQLGGSWPPWSTRVTPDDALLDTTRRASPKHAREMIDLSPWSDGVIFAHQSTGRRVRDRVITRCVGVPSMKRYIWRCVSTDCRVSTRVRYFHARGLPRRIVADWHAFIQPRVDTTPGQKRSARTMCWAQLSRCSVLEQQSPRTLGDEAFDRFWKRWGADVVGSTP